MNYLEQSRMINLNPAEKSTEYKIRGNQLFSFTRLLDFVIHFKMNRVNNFHHIRKSKNFSGGRVCCGIR